MKKYEVFKKKFLTPVVNYVKKHHDISFFELILSITGEDCWIISFKGRYKSNPKIRGVFRSKISLESYVEDNIFHTPLFGISIKRIRKMIAKELGPDYIFITSTVNNPNIPRNSLEGGMFLIKLSESNSISFVLDEDKTSNKFLIHLDNFKNDPSMNIDICDTMAIDVAFNYKKIKKLCFKNSDFLKFFSYIIMTEHDSPFISNIMNKMTEEEINCLNNIE